MNVSDYLKRINYEGPTEPTLEVLKAIHKAHVTSVPYSNLAFHGGLTFSLTYEDMYNTIVTKRQGNTCYRCNGAFSWLLRNMGYTVRLGHGKMFLGGGFYADYSHLTPVVEIDGEDWLVDVGWLLYEPLKMEMMKPQIQPHGIHRIRSAESDFGENWFHVERFKKTVLDKDGAVLKQGPSLPGGWDGDLDCDEMKKIDPNLWTITFAFHAGSHSLSEFEASNKMHQNDPTFVLQECLCSHLFTKNGIMYRMWLGNFIKKKFLNPITDQILEERKIVDDKDAMELAEEYFNVKLNFELNFFKNLQKKKNESTEEKN